MKHAIKNRRYYLVAVCISVSLVFWLEVFGWQTLLSSMSCEGSLVRNEAAFCLIMNTMKNIFGPVGLQLFFIAGGILTLYLSWHFIKLESLPKPSVNGSTIGNKLAVILGVSLLILVLFSIIMAVKNNA